MLSVIGLLPEIESNIFKYLNFRECNSISQTCKRGRKAAEGFVITYKAKANLEQILHNYLPIIRMGMHEFKFSHKETMLRCIAVGFSLDFTLGGRISNIVHESLEGIYSSKKNDQAIVTSAENLIIRARFTKYTYNEDYDTQQLIQPWVYTIVLDQSKNDVFSKSLIDQIAIGLNQKPELKKIRNLQNLAHIARSQQEKQSAFNYKQAVKQVLKTHSLTLDQQTPVQPMEESDNQSTDETMEIDSDFLSSTIANSEIVGSLDDFDEYFATEELSYSPDDEFELRQ